MSIEVLVVFVDDEIVLSWIGDDLLSVIEAILS
jgi:hypothetical protein